MNDPGAHPAPQHATAGRALSPEPVGRGGRRGTILLLFAGRGRRRSFSGGIGARRPTGATLSSPWAAAPQGISMVAGVLDGVSWNNLNAKEEKDWLMGKTAAGWHIRQALYAERWTESNAGAIGCVDAGPAGLLPEWGHPELRVRAAQLNSLRAAIKRYEHELMAALKRDLGKPDMEAYAGEVGFVYTEIRHILRDLKEWMTPKRVGTPLPLQPSTSFVVSEPLGEVLIIAPWNYPFQLTVAPLIGAMAAGNCAVVKPSELAPHTAEVVERLLGETFPGSILLWCRARRMSPRRCLPGSGTTSSSRALPRWAGSWRRRRPST